jgi:hypothetical protein
MNIEYLKPNLYVIMALSVIPTHNYLQMEYQKYLFISKNWITTILTFTEGYMSGTRLTYNLLSFNTLDKYQWGIIFAIIQMKKLWFPELSLIQGYSFRNMKRWDSNQDRATEEIKEENFTTVRWKTGKKTILPPKHHLLY